MMDRREMTLTDIQDVGLSVLEEFHSFCTSHNLRYSLAYGTLIGAVRHKGFIPWDDDIDVLMPRPDYERLKAAYSDSRDFSLIWPGKDNSCLQFSRLCDISRTSVKSKSPWHDSPNGVWIDIFPVDAAPDDTEKARTKYRKCHRMFRELLKKRRTLRYRAESGFESKIKLAAYLLAGKTKPVKAALQMDSFCKEMEYGSTGQLINYSYPYLKKVVIYPFEAFEHYTDVQFCGRTFKAMNDYDGCLRAVFGDYMQLPPESQRVPGHSFQDFLWL